MAPSLPDYSNPPINEVVCGVQFSALSKFLTPHYGLFWELVKNEYPLVEDHPVLAPINAPSDPLIFDLPPMRRVFYIEAGQNYLIQLQATRFLTNWRKINDNDVYARFVNISKRFYDNWTVFNEFLMRNQIEAPEVNQYELTYINQILEEPSTLPLRSQKYFPIFAIEKAKSEILPIPKAATWNLRYDLPDKSGSLAFAFKHGTRKTDQKDLAVLEITARGPANPDASNMKKWFEVAHDHIVQGFTDITSKEAHKLWGRNR